MISTPYFQKKMFSNNCYLISILLQINLDVAVWLLAYYYCQIAVKLLFTFIIICERCYQGCKVGVGSQESKLKESGVKFKIFAFERVESQSQTKIKSRNQRPANFASTCIPDTKTHLYTLIRQLISLRHIPSLLSKATKRVRNLSALLIQHAGSDRSKRGTKH